MLFLSFCRFSKTSEKKANGYKESLKILKGYKKRFYVNDKAVTN